jgi:hypothetical protein
MKNGRPESPHHTTNVTCCARCGAVGPPKTESEDAHACSEDGDLRIRMANPWSRPYAPKDRGQRTRRCLANGKRVLAIARRRGTFLRVPYWVPRQPQNALRRRRRQPFRPIKPMLGAMT